MRVRAIGESDPLARLVGEERRVGRQGVGRMAGARDEGRDNREDGVWGWRMEWGQDLMSWGARQDRVSLRAGRPPVGAGNGRAGWAMREGNNGAACVREREESENHKRRTTRWALRACKGWTGWTICMMTETETRRTSRGRLLGRRQRTG